MLVLSRRRGEALQIGANIVIEVVDIEGGRVRLGIRAPRDVPVYRGELIKQEQEKKPPPPPARTDESEKTGQ